MKKFLRVTLSLDENTNRILNIFSKNNKIKKSKLIRYLLLYFNQAPYKLDKILEKEKKILKRKKDQKIWMDKIHNEILQQIRGKNE